MKLKCYNFKTKGNYRVTALGDMHFGSKECDVKLFEEKLKWLKKQEDLGIVLMGDLINCGTRYSVGAGTYDDDWNPQEQYEHMIDYLKPLKDKILLVHHGNHEERIRKETSFDITKLLAKELGVPYAEDYTALTKLRVNNNNYVVCSTHGSGSGTTAAGKMNACMKLANITDADLYLYGHTHALSHAVTPYRKVDYKNKTIKELERHFVLTGSFVKWDGGYGEQKHYSLLKRGMPTVTLGGDKWDIQADF